MSEEMQPIDPVTAAMLMGQVPDPCEPIIEISHKVLTRLMDVVEFGDQLERVEKDRLLAHLKEVLAADQPQLWAMHSPGPGEVHPMISKEEAEQQAAELTALCNELHPTVPITVNVIPSPFSPLEHFELLAEETIEQRDDLLEHVKGLEEAAKALATDATLDKFRASGLSIDGDNAYKRDLLDAVVGAMMLGRHNTTPPPAGHWAQRFWDIGREYAELPGAIVLPMPVMPEQPEDAIDDSWMDGYNAALRMREECQRAIDAAGTASSIAMPAGLHPDTQDLVTRFATALAVKLHAAELKHGYSNGWKDPNWMDEFRQKLIEHLAKGDPRDVAAYCAFLWHHCQSTSAPAALPATAPDRSEQVQEGYVLVPERMHLDANVIEAINYHCGDGQKDAGYGEHVDGLLWVGFVEDEDGAKSYGLNIATAEYPEEGSTQLVEFVALSLAPLSEQARDADDEPFSCEHAACKSLGQHHPLCAGYKRIKAEAAAPLSGSQGGDV